MADTRVDDVAAFIELRDRYDGIALSHYTIGVLAGARWSLSELTAWAVVLRVFAAFWEREKRP